MFFVTDAEDTMLAKIQGDVFEESCRLGLDSRIFIREYMASQTAALLDLPHHKLRWCGQAHLLDEFLREKDIPMGSTWDEEKMFWIGYTYRFWHSLTGQPSREITRLADADLMSVSYPKMHMDNVVAAVNALLKNRQTTEAC